MSDRIAANTTSRHGLEGLFESLPTAAGKAWTVRLTAKHGYVNLRGDAGDAAFVAAAARTLGQELPLDPNTFSDGAHRIYWLGPDEWLVGTPRQQPADLVAELREALAGHHASVTDQSGGLVRLELAGEAVEDLLAKGCTLDLHPSVFGPGRCAQTGLAKASVLLARADAEERAVFELYVRRSFARYVFLWLSQVGQPHGSGFIPER